MRHLARVTSQITDLMYLLGRVYRKPDIFARMKNDDIELHGQRGSGDSTSSSPT